LNQDLLQFPLEDVRPSPKHDLLKVAPESN